MFSELSVCIAEITFWRLSDVARVIGGSSFLNCQSLVVPYFV